MELFKSLETRILNNNLKKIKPEKQMKEKEVRYSRRKEFDKKIINDFEVGCLTNSRNSFKSYAIENGFNEDDLISLSENDADLKIRDAAIKALKNNYSNGTN